MKNIGYPQVTQTPLLTFADITFAQTFVWVRQAKFGHVHSGQ
jgi:hypothetical protein